MDKLMRSGFQSYIADYNRRRKIVKKVYKPKTLDERINDVHRRLEVADKTIKSLQNKVKQKRIKT